MSTLWTFHSYNMSKLQVDKALIQAIKTVRMGDLVVKLLKKYAGRKK